MGMTIPLVAFPPIPPPLSGTSAVENMIVPTTFQPDRGEPDANRPENDRTMDQIIIAVTIGLGLLYAYRRFRKLGDSVKQSFHDGREQTNEN